MEKLREITRRLMALDEDEIQADRTELIGLLLAMKEILEERHYDKSKETLSEIQTTQSK